MSKDFFSEIDEIVKKQMGVDINNIKITNKASFEINILKKETKSFFDSLTKGINNLKDFEFNSQNQAIHLDGEVLIKLGLILFVLNKKLETRI